jgi:TRAP-type transport system periplasmic protein
MKKLIYILFVICISVVSCGNDGVHPGEKIIFRMSDVHPNDFPTVQAELYFSKILNERSGGRIILRVYADGQLGQGKVISEAARNGILDLSVDSVATYAKDNLEIMALQGLPYLFNDKDHFWRALEGDYGKEIMARRLWQGDYGKEITARRLRQGDYGKEITARRLRQGDYGKEITKSFDQKGAIVLGFFDAGARSFYSKKPIRTPQDIKGLKIRYANKLSENIVKLLGGKEIDISYSEIYPGFQTGKIDGAENNPASFVSEHHFELAKYFTLDEHGRLPDILSISKKTWNDLSRKDQILVKECAAEAVKEQHRLWDEYEGKVMSQMRAFGVTVIVPDKKAFRDAVQPLYDEQSAYSETIKRIQSL